MKRFAFLIIITIGLIGCSSPDYSNKEVYEVKVGEQFNIYFTSNSCCQQCFSNSNEQDIVELVNQKVVESEPDCSGCDETSAYSFKAIKTGNDTIYLHSTTMNKDCYDIKERVAEFVVIVN